MNNSNYMSNSSRFTDIDLSTIGDKPRPPWLLLRPPTLLVNKCGRRVMF